LVKSISVTGCAFREPPPAIKRAAPARTPRVVPAEQINPEVDVHKLSVADMVRTGQELVRRTKIL
jgi:hypothetical protein